MLNFVKKATLYLVANLIAGFYSYLYDILVQLGAQHVADIVVVL